MDIFKYEPYTKAYLTSSPEGLTKGDAHAAKDAATNKNANLLQILGRADSKDIYRMTVERLVQGREAVSTSVTEPLMDKTMEQVFEMLPEIAQDASEIAYYNNALKAQTTLEETIKRLSVETLCEELYGDEYRAVKEKGKAPVRENLGTNTNSVYLEGTIETIKVWLNTRAIEYVTPELIVETEKAFVQVQKLGALIKNNNSLFAFVSGKNNTKRISLSTKHGNGFIEIETFERAIDIDEELAKKYHELHQSYQKKYDTLMAKVKTKLVDLQEIMDEEYAAKLAAHNALVQSLSAKHDEFIISATAVRSALLRQAAEMRIKPFAA